jgi:hypothetical protein
MVMTVWSMLEQCVGQLDEPVRCFGATSISLVDVHHDRAHPLGLASKSPFTEAIREPGLLPLMFAMSVATASIHPSSSAAVGARSYGW